MLFAGGTGLQVRRVPPDGQGGGARFNVADIDIRADGGDGADDW